MTPNDIELEKVDGIVYEDDDGRRYHRFWDGDEIKEVRYVE